MEIVSQELSEKRGRQRYDAKTREMAGDMFVHRRMSVYEISDALNIPIATLHGWQSQDNWSQDRDNEESDSFAQTCNYLMKTINRLSSRLFQSTIPDGPDEDYVLPDENLELRINRLTLAVERILPMGNMLMTKQRVDVLKEIRKLGFESVSKGVFTDQEMMGAFRVLDHYLDSLNIPSKK